MIGPQLSLVRLQGRNGRAAHGVKTVGEKRPVAYTCTLPNRKGKVSLLKRTHKSASTHGRSTSGLNIKKGPMKWIQGCLPSCIAVSRPQSLRSLRDLREQGYEPKPMRLLSRPILLKSRLQTNLTRNYEIFFVIRTSHVLIHAACHRKVHGL